MNYFLRGWQKNVFFFFQKFIFTFCKQGANIEVESRIIFSKWISKNLWASTIWITETFWLHCGNINNMNVYSYRMSKRERESSWSFYIPFIRSSFDDCGIFFGCEFLFFNQTFRWSSSARYKTKEFTNVIVGHSKKPVDLQWHTFWL